MPTNATANRAARVSIRFVIEPTDRSQLRFCGMAQREARNRYQFVFHGESVAGVLPCRKALQRTVMRQGYLRDAANLRCPNVLPIAAQMFFDDLLTYLSVIVGANAVAPHFDLGIDPPLQHHRVGFRNKHHIQPYQIPVESQVFPPVIPLLAKPDSGREMGLRRRS